MSPVLQKAAFADFMTISAFDTRDASSRDHIKPTALLVSSDLIGRIYGDR